MKIIYDDYGGTHSTPVSAAIHLGILPPDQVPTSKELLELPLFDHTTSEDHGYLVNMGQDEEGHDVYILGRGSGNKIVERAVASGFLLAGGEVEGLRFFDTLPHVNWWMRIGGFLSRALGLVALGRPLVLYGTRKAYPDFAALVAEAKAWAHTAAAKGQLLSSDKEDLGRNAKLATMEGVLPGVAEKNRGENGSKQE